MTPTQVRMARAALNWSIDDLAQASGVDLDIISGFEAGGRSSPSEALAAVRSALEAAGVIFLREDGIGPGVRLREGAATERDAAPQEMLLTLREGRAALQAELDMLAGAPSLEPELLRRLRGSATEFAGQASFLAVTMEGPDQNHDLVGEARQLLSFFQLVKDQFASLLEGGWARTKEEASKEAEV